MCDDRNAVCMPLNGKVVCIDGCIHHIVAALNAGGVWTTASCCGHNGDPLDHARIDLEDGRVLMVLSANQYDRQCALARENDELRQRLRNAVAAGIEVRQQRDEAYRRAAVQQEGATDAVEIALGVIADHHRLVGVESQLSTGRSTYVERERFFGDENNG